MLGSDPCDINDFHIDIPFEDLLTELEETDLFRNEDLKQAETLNKKFVIAFENGEIEEEQSPDENELPTFGCTNCYEEFILEKEYNEHDCMHLQSGDGESNDTESSRCETSNDTEIWQALQDLEEILYPAADLPQAPVPVAPQPIEVEEVENFEIKVPPAEETPPAQHVLNHAGINDKQPENNIRANININPSYTNCVFILGDVTLNINNVSKASQSNDASETDETASETAVAKPFQCHVCDYKGTYYHNFRRHVKTHSGEKPYSCKYCDFKCALKHGLVLHMRAHSGERPYSCKQCEYRGSNSYALLTHVRTHTGEKPYTCKICGYKCAHRSTLVLHTKSHK
ncbi:zinc finger protein 37 homolog [Pararge aegeria]|nr:zinc finger protein 37 homolog [Pararge aegeria]XP_039762417.1 zinc finger protein 37 homolog [Pararge aegeria]